MIFLIVISVVGILCFVFGYACGQDEAINDKSKR